MDQTSELINNLVKYQNDPLGFTRWSWPHTHAAVDRWKSNILPWHEDLFKKISGRFVFDVEDKVEKYRFFGWVAIWYLCTHPYAQVAMTSGLDESLEVMWTNLDILWRKSKSRKIFKITKDQLYIKPHKWSWNVIRVPYIEGRPERFAGCLTEHSLMIMDEADYIEDEVFNVVSSYCGSVILSGYNMKYWVDYLNGSNE